MRREWQINSHVQIYKTINKDAINMNYDNGVKKNAEMNSSFEFSTKEKKMCMYKCKHI